MDFRLVDDQVEFEALLDDLITEKRIAVDTEFHREKTYFPKVAMVQVAWADGLVLIDPLEVDLRPMARLLESDVLVVMHAAGQDLEVFDRACGTVPVNLFDTQLAAGFIGLSSPSLASLHERELGLRLPKGDRLTDWLARPLTESQLNYAASDVAHLLEIHDRLVHRLRDDGRLAWAEQECVEMLARERGRRRPEDAWMRIKEARQLRGRARDVARSVAAWRERRAAEVDQPVRHVVPDLGVVAVAQRAPRTVDELRKVRGLDGRHYKGAVAEGLLGAVATADDLPPLEVVASRSDNGNDVRAAVTLVSAWVAQLSRDIDLDPTLVGTRSDIEDLVRGAPSAKMTTGWRHQVVGGPVDDLLSGRAALAFDGRGGLLLEPRQA
ncbi:MAG: HRDC domain-containing protein [Actinomycetota bacterium]|nr:HRDC domain-containing protein [Actinomycetota bacterium]MED5220413.1 HRDC domain-containing protein [Actinomycetota bacterium]MED5233223.1 HRDC domain-containing protein [Actinomycetota bacterium]MED5394823.1 HRDC domain-containing protein [Actinomycetota bacterium]MEE3354239.1 HRDC domain-containing protein [Actinomycetota bacterium]